MSVETRFMRLQNPALRRYLQAFRTPKGGVGAALLLLLSLLAVSAPLLFPHGYDVQTAQSLQGPSLAHPFGTDELGRDIFTRSIFGLRADLSIIVVAVPAGVVIGTAIGLVGALSPSVGTVMQRILDVVLGFPAIVLGACIVLVLGTGWTSLVVTIAVASLPTFGRLSRAAMLSQQQREYVTAARTLGVPRTLVVTRHILPNAIDPILVSAAVYVVYAIFIESGLSIIGLGIQPPQPSLGSLLNNATRFINQSPSYIVGPTLTLFVLALAFSLISDALNRTVNRA